MTQANTIRATMAPTAHCSLFLTTTSRATFGTAASPPLSRGRPWPLEPRLRNGIRCCPELVQDVHGRPLHLGGEFLVERDGVVQRHEQQPQRVIVPQTQCVLDPVEALHVRVGECLSGQFLERGLQLTHRFIPRPTPGFRGFPKPRVSIATSRSGFRTGRGPPRLPRRRRGSACAPCTVAWSRAWRSTATRR